MFGELIAQLDRPEIAVEALAVLDDRELESTICRYAAANDIAVADCVAGIVRGFVDQADDEAWVQLVGIMTRAEDPGMAALGAILRYCARDLEAALAA
jgi:hypothetical protein